MTKGYTELYTFAEVDRAIADGKTVEFLSVDNTWQRALRSRPPRRFRIVEEVEEIQQPVFGDEIIVWPGLGLGADKVRRKFVCFDGHGSPIILNFDGRGTTTYPHWCWPEEVKDGRN